jgi:hypothetical protein
MSAGVEEGTSFRERCPRVIAATVGAGGVKEGVFRECDSWDLADGPADHRRWSGSAPAVAARLRPRTSAAIRIAAQATFAMPNQPGWRA